MTDQTSSTSPPRGRPRSPQSREAILRATSALIREEGYSQLSIEAIAARAGVGKQTIYRWWPSKGAVAVEAFLGEIRTRFPMEESGEDFRTEVTGAISRAAEQWSDPEFGPYVAALTCAALHDPAVAEALYQHVVGPSRAGHREWMTRAQAAGEVRADIDVDLAIDLMYAPIWFRLLTRTVPLSELDPVALSDAVLRAIQPPPGEGTGA